MQSTHNYLGRIGRLTCIGSYVNNQVTTFAFRAQATTSSKHHTRTVMERRLRVCTMSTVG